MIDQPQLKNYITLPNSSPKTENKNTSPYTWFIILFAIRIDLLWALGSELDTLAIRKSVHLEVPTQPKLFF